MIADAFAAANLEKLIPLSRPLHRSDLDGTKQERAPVFLTLPTPTEMAPAFVTATPVAAASRYVPHRAYDDANRERAHVRV